MKHTPGPWTFRPDPSEAKCKACNQNIPAGPWNYLIEGKKASLIAKVWVPVGDPYSDVANAKLIAAAPLMLSHLENLLKALKRLGCAEEDNAVVLTKAVIKKATS